MDNPPSNILSYEFPGQALIYSVRYFLDDCRLQQYFV